MKIDLTIKQVSEEERKLLIDIEAQMRGFKVFENKKNFPYFSSLHPNINIQLNTNLFPKNLFFTLIALETKSSARSEILQLLLSYANNSKKMRSNQFKRVASNIFDIVTTMIGITFFVVIISMLPMAMLSLLGVSIQILMGLSIAAFVGSILGFFVSLKLVANDNKTLTENNSILEQNTVLITKLKYLIEQVKFELSVENEGPPAYSEAIKTNQTIDPACNEAPPEYSEAIKTKQTIDPAHIFFKKQESANSELLTPCPILSNYDSYSH